MFILLFITNRMNYCCKDKEYCTDSCGLFLTLNFIHIFLNKVVIGDTNGQIKINNQNSLVSSFQAHSSSIYRIKQSPFNTNYVATCSNKEVKIWNVLPSLNWTLITTYSQHTSGVYGLEWLDKDTLASAGYLDNEFKLWSMATGQTKRTIQTNQNFTSLKLLNNNIHLAAGLLNGDINIYNINDGYYLVSSLKGHTSAVLDLVQISADLLASSSYDGTVRIWDLTTNTCKFILTGHTNSVWGLKQITPNILASGSSDKTIKLWDITSGKLIRTLTGHTSYVYLSVDLLNNGQTLVSGSGDGTIKLWNRSTGECFSTIQVPGSRIISLVVVNFDQQQTQTATTTTSMSSKTFCFFIFYTTNLSLDLELITISFLTIQKYDQRDGFFSLI
jgi:WD40 repeat protein